MSREVTLATALSVVMIRLMQVFPDVKVMFEKRDTPHMETICVSASLPRGTGHIVVEKDAHWKELLEPKKEYWEWLTESMIRELSNHTRSVSSFLEVPTKI